VPAAWADVVTTSFWQGLNSTTMSYELAKGASGPALMELSTAGTWTNAAGAEIAREVASVTVNGGFMSIGDFAATGVCEMGSEVVPLLAQGPGGATMSTENPKVAQIGLNARVLYDGTVEAVNFTADGEVWADSVSAPRVNGTRPAVTQHCAQPIRRARGLQLSLKTRAKGRPAPLVRKMQADASARYQAMRARTRIRRAHPPPTCARRLAAIATTALAQTRKRKVHDIARVNGAETKRLRAQISALPTTTQSSSARWRAAAGAAAQRDLRTRHQLMKLRARFGRQAVPQLRVVKRLAAAVFAQLRKRKHVPPVRDLSREVKRLRASVNTAGSFTSVTVNDVFLPASDAGLVGISFSGTTAGGYYAYYMARSAGKCWDGVNAAQSYNGITSWAQRSRVRNLSSQGWIWEGAPSAPVVNGVTMLDTPVMGLNAGTGNLQVMGGVTAGGDITTTGNVTCAEVSTTYSRGIQYLPAYHTFSGDGTSGSTFQIDIEGTDFVARGTQVFVTGIMQGRTYTAADTLNFTMQIKSGNNYYIDGESKITVPYSTSDYTQYPITGYFFGLTVGASYSFNLYEQCYTNLTHVWKTKRWTIHHIP
jgi:hypothetical protein